MHLSSFAKLCASASVAGLQPCRVDTQGWNRACDTNLSPLRIACMAEQGGIRLAGRLVKVAAEIFAFKLVLPTCSLKRLIQHPLRHLRGQFVQVTVDFFLTHGASLSSEGTHVQQLNRICEPGTHVGYGSVQEKLST